MILKQSSLNRGQIIKHQVITNSFISMIYSRLKLLSSLDLSHDIHCSNISDQHSHVPSTLLNACSLFVAFPRCYLSVACCPWILWIRRIPKITPCLFSNSRFWLCFNFNIYLIQVSVFNINWKNLLLNLKNIEKFFFWTAFHEKSTSATVIYLSSCNSEMEKNLSAFYD